MSTPTTPTDIDIDGIIFKLLEVRGSRPGKQGLYFRYCNHLTNSSSLYSVRTSEPN